MHGAVVEGIGQRQLAEYVIIRCFGFLEASQVVD
jgi:hypothetical protein